MVTKELVEELYKRLIAKGVEDYQFDEANGLQTGDTIVLSRDGKNLKVDVLPAFDDYLDNKGIETETATEEDIEKLAEDWIF